MMIEGVANMSTPLYIVMDKEEYRALESKFENLQLAPSLLTMLEKPEFLYRFSNIIQIEVLDTWKKMADGARKLADIIPFAEVDGSIVTMNYDNMICRYAWAKMNAIRDAIEDMSADDYIRGGNRKLINIISTPKAYVYPCGAAFANLILSVDDFVCSELADMKKGETRKLVVTNIMYCENKAR